MATMPISESPERQPVKSARLVFRPQGDRVLIYHAATDQLYTLQPLGAEILRKCDGTRSSRELAAQTFGEAASGSEQEAVFSKFLSELERRELISWQADRDGKHAVA
jgi:hypothetical protein